MKRVIVEQVKYTKCWGYVVPKFDDQAFLCSSSEKSRDALPEIPRRTKKFNSPKWVREVKKIEITLYKFVWLVFIGKITRHEFQNHYRFPVIRKDNTK